MIDDALGSGYSQTFSQDPASMGTFPEGTHALRTSLVGGAAVPTAMRVVATSV